MKRKFIISVALAMTVAFSLPAYVYADNSNSDSSKNSTVVTVDKTNTEGTSSTSTTNNTTNTTNTTTNNNTASSKLKLSLDDALSRVENSYNQIVLDDRYIEILDRQYQQALAYQKAIKKNISNPMEEEDEKTLSLNVPVALYELNNKKHEREVNLKQAKVTIMKEYQSILAAQLNVEYIKQEMKKLQKEIDSLESTIKAGVAVESDRKQFEAAMASYRAKLNSAQNEVKSLMISLKNDLGIDLNTELELTSQPITYTKFDDSKLDDRIESAIENSYTIESLKQQIKNSEIEYGIYDRHSNTNKDSVEITIETLKNQLEQTPNSIRVQLKTQYNALKSLESVIKADKLSIEAADINLNIAEQKYKVGQNTYLDVLNAKLQLVKAKNTLQQDIISYMTAAQGFENSLELQ